MAISIKANPDATSGAIQINGTDRVTFDNQGNLTVAGAVSCSSISGAGGFGFRNKIINGDMRIDQRNAGASVAVNENGLFTVDRWRVYEYGAPAVSAQQVSDAPSGFFSSLRVTVTTAGSLVSTDFCAVNQPIEANNLTDFAFGTSAAAACTLSFWVKSSLTGTFSGTLTNDVGSYGYGFTYTISAANTWEYKTVVVPAATGGTWNRAGVSLGMQLYFSLGAATSRSMASGAWGSTSITATGVTGSVSLVGTNGATFYITGVQLEAGTVATPFESRPYGTELALCQRYYWKPDMSGNQFWFNPIDLTNIYRRCQLKFPVTMRTAPNCTISASTSGTFAANNPKVSLSSPEHAYCEADLTGAGHSWMTAFTASAEL